MKFHNGDPLTSADVKYSLERSWDPALKTRVNTVFTTIDKVEAPDPRPSSSTPRSRTRCSLRAWPSTAARSCPRSTSRPSAPTAFNLKPIGTGPVRFVSWTKDDRRVLEANPDYWGGKPDVDRMIFRPIPETAPRVAAAAQGRGRHDHRSCRPITSSA